MSQYKLGPRTLFYKQGSVTKHVDRRYKHFQDADRALTRRRLSVSKEYLYYSFSLFCAQVAILHARPVPLRTKGHTIPCGAALGSVIFNYSCELPLLILTLLVTD